MKKNFSEDINALIFKICNINTKLNQVARNYGHDIWLKPTEVHILEFIGDYPNHNTTQIAKALGITKGLVSRITNRLESKCLIKKFQFTDNKKKTYYQLTQEGQIAYEGHRKHHCKIDKEERKKFEKYSDKEKKLIYDFLKDYAENAMLLLDTESEVEGNKR